MPKKSSKPFWGGRNGRPNNSEEKHYFGHDDRAVRMDGSSRPRVSFKTQVRPHKDRPRNLDFAVKHHFDDDISMTTASTYSSNNNGRQVIVRGRGRGISRGRNSPLPHRGIRGDRPRQMPFGESNSYKIVIPYGHKYEKHFVITNLLSYMAPDTFVPIMYKVLGNDAVFYVDDHRTANKLFNCDRKITTSDGFKLQVRVKPGFPQQCEVDDIKERLKQAMSKRYVLKTNALDLSKFHHDPDLIEDYFCALFRPGILMPVLDIVAEHIPNLEALNLDENKLQIIERLNVLSKKFSQLKILYIGDNKIREISQLDTIKDLKLEELRLAGNPVCNKYKLRQNDYVSLPGFRIFFLGNSDVRKRFPKLIKLDGIELPRPILFDEAEEGVKLPPTQRIFVINSKAQEIAGQFLERYFLIFDSENRQPLLDAYHEHACFSMTVAYAYSSNKANGYLSENRNLHRLTDGNRRFKLLKQGRLPVVSFISQMPPTKHDLNSFTMDIGLATEGMMCITVTGMFKELDDKEELIRYFNRTFIIVPEGYGYCIRNEQLHISNPTEAQKKQAFMNNQPIVQVPGPASTSTPSTSTSLPSGSIPAVALATLSEDTKQQMTLTLSQQTNMNLEWSLKCLEEVQWNFDNAISAFQEFFKRGQIPPEAFKK